MRFPLLRKKDNIYKKRIMRKLLLLINLLITLNLYSQTYWYGTSSRNITDQYNWYSSTKGFHVPDSTDDVIILDVNLPPTINKYYPKTDGNFYFKSLIIYPGTYLEIRSTDTLKIKNDVSIETDYTRRFSGNLMQYGTLDVGGNVYFKRYVTKNYWHYISTPVENALSNIFFGFALYRYNELNSNWSPIGLNDTLITFLGYDAKINNHDVIVTFIGKKFNNGTYAYVLTKNNNDGWHLIGNPYPSGIDWDNNSGWVKTGINNGVYIWDGAISNYTSYVNGVGTNGGSNIIPATQSFFISVHDTASIGYLSINRNSISFNDSISYRNQNIIDPLVRIKINQYNYKDETVLRFNKHTNYNFNGDYDTYKFFSGTPSVYSKINDISFSINSVSMPDTGFILQLYFSDLKMGKIEINIKEENFFKYNLFLFDKHNGNFYEIKNELDLTLTDLYVENEERLFILIFPKQEFATINEYDKYKNYSQEVLDEKIYMVYDLNGKLIFENPDRMDIENLKKGFYIFIYIINGEFLPQKIIKF
jgi:hypothetical protein